MTRPTKVYIGSAGDGLIVLDADLRTYAAINRAGDRYHLIQPLEINHPLVGDGKRIAGELGCSCSGGVFKGSCYQVELAEQYEASIPKAATWFDAPVDAGELIEANRG